MSEGKKYSSLRSEEVQEIMSDIPGSILRWGISVIMVILVILFVGSYFFKYPDVITAELTVNAENPPAVIKARATGKIVALFVENQQEVASDMPLAVIENPAGYEDMHRLDSCLNGWNPERSSIQEGMKLFGDTLLRLGPVQAAYADFVTALQDYSRYLTLSYYQQKIGIQNNQLKSRKYHQLEMMQQRQLLKMQLANTVAVFRRDSLLYLKGVTSEEDFEASRSDLLKIRQSVSALSGSIKEAEIEVSQISESMLDLEQEDREHESLYIQNLRNAYQQVVTDIKTWEQDYLLISPIRGTVNLMGNWSINQNIELGETIFTVLPAKLSVSIGKAMVPTQGSGKVKVGQKAHVHLTNYPDQEFGFIEGTVRSLSEVPLPDGCYVAEIVFPNGLNTTYSVAIPATGTLSGYAEIITEDIRLLERIIMPVRRLAKKHFR